MEIDKVPIITHFTFWGHFLELSLFVLKQLTTLLLCKYLQVLQENKSIDFILTIDKSRTGNFYKVPKQMTSEIYKWKALDELIHWYEATSIEMWKGRGRTSPGGGGTQYKSGYRDVLQTWFAKIRLPGTSMGPFFFENAVHG